jgi:hypothetical protein
MTTLASTVDMKTRAALVALKVKLECDIPRTEPAPRHIFTASRWRKGDEAHRLRRVQK